MKKKNLPITILVLFAFVLSVLSPYTAHAANDPLENPSEVALEYMNIRREMLISGNTTALAEIAISGIVADEVKHREYLAEKNITIPEVSYTVDSVEVLEGGTYVTLREIGTTTSIEVTHILLMTTNEKGLPFVVSDNYMETHTGFVSACYVAPETSVHSRSYMLVSRSCLTSVAYSEIGYLEKASNSQLDSNTANPGNGNYTKYGAWYGTNGVPWCAIFVSWCANQAHIPVSIIPKEAYVPSLHTFFNGQNRYYKSAAKGGSYTPQEGDLIFIYWDGADFGHVGIVSAVSSSTVTIIEGNWNARVNTRSLSLTNTTITGYASPNIANTDHIWVGNVCSNCGAYNNPIM